MASQRSWTLTLAAALVVVVCGGLLYRWWGQKREDDKLREATLPACSEQLGGEASCREHLARYHDDCARLTRVRPSRYSGGADAPNPAEYLSCVVQGVDGWVAANGRKSEALGREQREDTSPR